MVAGGPGAGKSTLAVQFAVRSRSRVLYVAQDTPTSVLARIASLVAGIPVAEAARSLTDGDELLFRALEGIPPEKLVLSGGSHTVEDVRAEIEAYREWVGEVPDLVVIDNLVDMVSSLATAAETRFYADVLLKLKQVAINLDVAIMVLHHVTRSGENSEHGLGRSPITMKDLLFAGEREARHVWGVYNNGRDMMIVQVLKQQDGPADPYGTMRYYLRWDPERSSLYEA